MRAGAVGVFMSPLLQQKQSDGLILLHGGLLEGLSDSVIYIYIYAYSMVPKLLSMIPKRASFFP